MKTKKSPSPCLLTGLPAAKFLGKIPPMRSAYGHECGMPGLDNSNKNCLFTRSFSKLKISLAWEIFNLTQLN